MSCIEKLKSWLVVDVWIFSGASEQFQAEARSSKENYLAAFWCLILMNDYSWSLWSWWWRGQFGVRWDYVGLCELWHRETCSAQLHRATTVMRLPASMYHQCHLLSVTSACCVAYCCNSPAEPVWSNVASLGSVGKQLWYAELSLVRMSMQRISWNWEKQEQE